MEYTITRHYNQDIITSWESLWKKSPQVTYANSSAWFLSVLKSFDYKEYAIVRVYNKKELVAIAGFVKEKKYGISFYTVAPGDFVCGLPMLLDIHNKTVVRTFLTALNELGTVSFDNIPEEIVAAFREQTSLLSASEQTINLYFAIEKDEKGAVRIPKRSRLTNRIKGQEDDFTMRTFDGATSEGLDIIFAIDEQSSKQHKGYSTFSDKTIKTFYKEFASQFGKQFLAAILYYKERPIAYYIGFLAGNTYFWSQNAFIADYQQYSPGKILLVKLIDFLGKQNVTIVDFGSGDYRMKRLLTNDYHKLFFVVLAKNTFIRNYFINVTKLKNAVYEQLHQRALIYTLYRKAKNIHK